MLNLPNTMLSERIVKRKYRFHIPGYAHLPCHPKYYSCAFTNKILKFADMMMSLGHEVYFYGAEGSKVNCTEFIQTHTIKDIRRAWGDKDKQGSKWELGYDWTAEAGYRMEPDTPERQAVIAKMFEAQIAGIQARKRPDDFLCLTMGIFHEPVKVAAKLLMTVETGVAYRGVNTRFCAYESEFQRNFICGMQGVGKDAQNGKLYDRVIPNYFRENEFPADAVKTNKADRVDKDGNEFILYVGRMIPRKGINIVAKLATDTKTITYFAGQGEIEGKSKLIRRLGVLNPGQRSWWMSRAKAVIVPTIYMEPFGGVGVEAMLSGTPILTTNFGVFPEYNQNGVTGYRCDMMKDFIKALSLVDSLDRTVIRKYAERYLMENIKWEYQRWFDEIYTLYEAVKSGDKKKIKNIWFAK